MSSNLWIKIESTIKNLFQEESFSGKPAHLSPTEIDSGWRMIQRQFHSLEAGTNPSFSLSEFSYPPSFPELEWNATKELQQDTMRTLQRESIRRSKEQTLSQNSQINRLAHLMLLALQSGNISLAMMLFSHLESRSANELSKVLMEKVQTLQAQKRELAQNIQEQKDDFEGSKAIQKIRSDMEQASDDISVLQTFIRDVTQNKQESIELANAFLNKEHETTMSVVRSFAR